MLLAPERQGVSPNPRHAGEEVALTTPAKAPFEEAGGGLSLFQAQLLFF